MVRRPEALLGEDSRHGFPEGWDPSDLWHPARAFEHPSQIVNHPDLTLDEKRAILASWASDACAPRYPERAKGVKQPVTFDDVIEALRTVDKQTSDRNCAPYQRLVRHERFAYRPPRPAVERRSIH